MKTEAQINSKIREIEGKLDSKAIKEHVFRIAAYAHIHMLKWVLEDG